jgi:hypothetical protein
MPSYDIGTAAFAVGAPKKWVDNLASHHRLPGVDSTRRGVRREFSFEAVVLLTVIRLLTEELGFTLSRAVNVAIRACQSADGEVEFFGGARLSLDLETLWRDVTQRLLEAAESVPRIRRGRPPRHATPSPAG